jgi:hypothetical protein
MKSLRVNSVVAFLLSFALTQIVAQTIPSSEAKSHIGERATVCGPVLSQHTATQSQGTPTFLDLDKPYPNESFTVLVWARDKGTVGTLPSGGQLCVTGTITQYRGGAEIVIAITQTATVSRFIRQRTHRVAYRPGQPLCAEMELTVSVSTEAARAPITEASPSGSDRVYGGRLLIDK